MAQRFLRFLFFLSLCSSEAIAAGTPASTSEIFFCKARRFLMELVRQSSSIHLGTSKIARPRYQARDFPSCWLW